ncbi:MAG: hypothetical protein ACPGCY_03725 [Henriciella sp.]
MAAHMRLGSHNWQFRAEVLSPDGQTKWQAEASILIGASTEELAELGRSVAIGLRQDAGGNLPTFEE